MRNYYLCAKYQEICMDNLNRIKGALADVGKTSVWLAGQLGKDPVMVSKWCTNTSQPPLETLIQIAQLLNVDVKELICIPQKTNRK